MADALDLLERSILSNEPQNKKQQQSTFDRHPVAYQYFLACLAFVGYAFIFSLPITGIFLLAIIPKQIISASDYLSVSFIFAEVAVALLALSLSLTLYQLKVALPCGRPLKPEEAPKLYSLLEELNQDLSAKKLQPKFDQIRISQHYEIQSVRTPRNGFPLFFTNTLVLGLPLLQSHSPKHLKMLMSREVIHLADARSRLPSWLSFATSYWEQYSQALRKQIRSPNIFLLVFFAWYAPLYKFFSQGIQTIERNYLDKKVANIYGEQHLSETLIQNFISKKYLQDSFWPHLSNKAYKHKIPPYLPYASLERNIKSKLDVLTSQSWLDSAFLDKEESNHDAELCNRLHKLSIENPTLPVSYQTSAAVYFLDSTLATLILQMDKLWVVSTKFIWQQKYLKGQSELTELRELGIQAEQGLLSDERIWQYIQLIKRYNEEPEAKNMYKKILQMDTKDAHISFEIGRTLLEHMDEDGISALEKTIQQEPGYTLMVCQILTRYYIRVGDNRSAQSCRRRALAHQVDAA